MFVSVRTYQGVTDFDEAVRVGNIGLLPLMEKQAGFHAYYVANCGGGILRSVSVFDTKNHAIAAYDAARGWVRDTISAIVPGTPTTINGEVTAPELAPKQVPIGAYMNMQSTTAPVSGGEGARITREKVWPQMINQPGNFGGFTFRNEADETHLLGIFFASDFATALRLQDRAWALLQQYAPELYPNQYVHSGGIVLTAAQKGSGA